MRNRVHQGRPCPTKRFNIKVVRCYKHKPMATNTHNTSHKTLQLPGARHQLKPVASVTGGQEVYMQAVLAETEIAARNCTFCSRLNTLKLTRVSVSDPTSRAPIHSHVRHVQNSKYFIRACYINYSITYLHTCMYALHIVSNACIILL